MSSTEITHLTTEQLMAGLDHVKAAPNDNGTLEMIVQRPAEDGRVVLEEGQLNREEGLAGDSWNQRGSDRTDDGSSHPDMQLNLMNSRICEMVAGSRDRMQLAGDQLIVDLDLSEANLPAWTKLQIGSAVIEMSDHYHRTGLPPEGWRGAIIQITDQPHNGCAKFTQRFGLDAHRFVNSPLGKELHLRGVNARVLVPGEIRPGDVIAKLA